MPKTIQSVSDQEVTIERRRKERRTAEAAGRPAKGEFKEPRRRQERRRQIDPTTCERDYNTEEINFMQAMDAYKRSSGRMFPTCSEILEVVRGLGYVKLSDQETQLLRTLEAADPNLAEPAGAPDQQ